MAKINTSIISQPTDNSLGSLLNDPNNIYNQALGSLPTEPTQTTDEVGGTDGLPGTDFITTDVTVEPVTTDTTSVDYSVWAAAWQREVSPSALSVVPMVWVDPMGGWGGPGTTDVFTDDLVSDAKYNTFKTTLLSVPQGRRVIQPTFWSAVPPNLNWSPLTFIDYYTALDGTSFDGRRIAWSPWQDNIIDDAKTSLNQFLSRCSADGLTFDYITDNTFYGDGGAPNIWNLSKPPVSNTDAYKIYVSTTGNDAWSGEYPTTNGTLGPVKTIKRASELARNYTGTKNVEIQIRQGTYRMLGTDSNPIFYLNESDSGKEGRYVTYRPYQNEQVVISGSEEISHTAFSIVTSSDPKWSRISSEARGNVYVADISAYDIGPGIPSMWNGGNMGGDKGNVGDMPAVPELIFNGKPMTVARWPNKTSMNSNGFTFAESAVISSVVDPGTNGVWCVDPEYLPNNYDLANPGTEDDESCWCNHPTNTAYNENCYRNGSFTYSSDYDSVISTWTSDAINDGIWLWGFWRWDWADEAYKVVSINTGTRTITVQSKKSQYSIQNYTLCDSVTGVQNNNGTYKSNPTPRRWYALNVLEELDTPGEYYIDRTNKKLYFWPTESINSSSEIRFTHRAVAGPGAKNDNTFEVGYSTNGQPSKTCPECFPYKGWEDTNFGWYQAGGALHSRHVYNSKNTLKSLFKFYKTKNIIIEGLTFRDSAGSGIELNLCENIIVRKCKVFNIKKDGINAMGGKNVTIDSCTLHDIGRHAIINTGGNRQTLEPANKVVTKCSIKRWNRNKYTYSSGIILNGCGNTASYNLLSDGSQGILVYGTNLTVEYNHFHNLQGETEDAGAIYAGRNMAYFNVVIRNNFFNQIQCTLPGGFYYNNVVNAAGQIVSGGCVTAADKSIAGLHCVYFDDLMSGCVVENNVFYKTASGHGSSVFINGGSQHKILNNIFVDCNEAYNATVTSRHLWNKVLSGQTQAIYNPQNYPWYETGGPLDSNGNITTVTGYSPYTWYGTGNGHVGWRNDSVAGIMPTVDIRTPVYQAAAPYLSEIITPTTVPPGVVIPQINVSNPAKLKNEANNNVIINTYYRSTPLGVNSLGSALDPNPVTYGGFTVGAQLIAGTDSIITFAERASLNFKLSASDLQTIRQTLPTFNDIPFEKIPTLSYAPDAYVTQTSSACATDNRHYTCLRDFSDPDALEAIITDSRFTSTVNAVNGKTLSQDFMDRYNAIIAKTNSMDRSLYTNHDNSWYVSAGSTPYNILSPNFGYIVNVGEPYRMQLFPWSNSSTDAATRAWTAATYDWGIYYRTLFFKQPLINNGYSNVKCSIDYSYSLNAEEAKYVQDQYGGWQGEVRQDNPDAMYTPALYGELETGMFNRYTYAINPENDDQRYMMGFVWENQDVPQGFLRYTSPVWVAFLRDLKLLRGIIRSNPNAWEKLTPWIPSPDGGYSSGSRMRYSRTQGTEALQYWKEMIFHACLHGTHHFNYWNAGAPTAADTLNNTIELHNILEEWRQQSGNSRAKPITDSRIASNSTVVVSGGRLLNSNKYLWRVTAKPSSSVTLRAYGASAGRTDIPQTITLNSDSRGTWLLTDSWITPLYVLDEGGQQTQTELKYITLMRADYSTLVYRNRAIFGGSSHDFGSGIGFDQNGKSLSALQYIHNTGITWSAHQVGNLNWYYGGNYRLNSAGTAIPVVVRTTPTTSVTLCNNACYSGAACYQTPGLSAIIFTKQMSETGEWGPAMRPTDPFPNGASGNFEYVTINGTVFTKQPNTTSKPTDYTYSYYGDSTSGGVPLSFWARSPLQNGRNDLAYDYTWQNSVQLRSGHEHVIAQSDLTKKIRSSADGAHVKNEPGNIWKYKGFVFAPIRQDDGCADHLFVDQYKILLNRYKEEEEYKHFVMNLPSVPSCIVQGETWKSLTAEEYENGVFRPKEIFVNYEEELVDQIRCLNMSGRNGPNNYGKVAGQPLTNEIWERIVSYIKLTRKMNYHIRSVFGPQVKISHYDMFNLWYYQEWKSGWYPAKDGIIWSTDFYEDRDNGCPFCSELDIGYPGDVAYAALPLEQKLVYIKKAVEALQNKMFKMGAVISKMCLFENVEGQPDVLDLRQELVPLLPQIDPNLFIIEGLNHYPNSAHGEICNNVHKYYAATQNGFNDAAAVNLKNNSESNKSRQQSIHHKEQARVGRFNNQRSGKLYSWFVQGVCGSDASEAFYEYYNSNLNTDAGFIKSWSSNVFTATEVSSFPTTETNPNHLAGERIYTNKIALKNSLRRSFLRHMPWINMTNDFLNRTQIATTIKYKDEIIWSDNNIASVILTNLNKLGSEPQGFFNQARPCAQGETPVANSNLPGGVTCRDITTQPYVKPVVIEDNFKLRINNFDTFSCSKDSSNSIFSPNCVEYCYANPVVPAAGSTSYPITSLLRARRHIYGLAVEYAGYDDMVAIPLEDFANDIYWAGYHGANANFDPFLTSPPATVAQAQAMDNTGWPHYRGSETAKRVQGLGLILAARKDYSIYKYIKNQNETNLRDWPQPPANFEVDRRPGIALTATVSGGDGADVLLGYTGTNTNRAEFFKKCLDGSNNPIPNTGFQRLIENYMTWNYNKGVRRFMLWTPGGTVFHQYPNGARVPVYTSAITSSMENRIYETYVVSQDGSTTILKKIVNPAEACWRNITTLVDPYPTDSQTTASTKLLIPGSVAEAESYPLCTDSDWDGTSPCFDPEGRKNEVLTCLQNWIDNHEDADVGIYMGYTIPTLNGQPETGAATIIGDAGAGNWLQNATGAGIRGWQIPNPENNAAHATFLQDELQPWIAAGIKFLGMDVGVGMFNYEYGGALSFGPNAASRTPVGDYKAWLQTTFPTLKTVINEAIQPDWKAPVLDEFNKPVAGRSYPRKTLLITDRSKEVCKGTLVSSESLGGEPWNSVYTDTCWHNKGRERFRKLDPAGKDYRTPSDPNNFVYAGGAYQYSPYLILLNGNLNSAEWNIGLHSNTNTIQGWGGLDPNKMWCWYRKNTEIGLFVESFYLLSKTMRDAYRLQNPQEVDQNGNNTYNNIWQFTPAWHDRGVATPTPAPSGIPSWDGRNTLRDSNLYNKVRNEMYVEIKNYIERGYVYWTLIGKDDFQLVKDVHSDLLDYIAGFETDDNIYPEDEITQNRSILDSNINQNIIIDTKTNKDDETLLQSIIDSGAINVTTDIGTDESLWNVGDLIEPAPGEFGESGGFGP